MAARFDVVSVGLIVADHVCAPIEAIPAPGSLITTPRLELTIGGCAANTAVDLAKLELNVAVVGRVGDDVLGRFCRETLESHGIDCTFISTSSTAQTAGTLIVNVQGEDRRFIHTVGANAELTGTEVSDDLLDQTRVLHIGGYILNPALSAENLQNLFRRARERGVFTVLDVVIGDPAKAWEMLKPVLPYTDLFLPNTDESLLITGETDVVRQAASLRKAGAGAVVITQGRRGSIASFGNELHESSAYQVEQVDGTGGGDAFVAGYLYGMLKHSRNDVLKCVQYGAAMGASCVQSMGATTGVFRQPELEAFVAKQPWTTRRMTEI